MLHGEHGHAEMVLDHHQIAHLVERVERAGRVRRNKYAAAEKLEDFHRQAAHCQRVAFERVKAALHAYDCYAANRTEY